MQIRDLRQQSQLERRKGAGPEGYAVGVLHIAAPFPVLPGNPLNATTFNFPVLYECALGVSASEVVSGDQACEAALIRAACTLEEAGVKTIVGLCGSFANFHKALTDAVDIPVFSSILVQTQFILSTLAENKTLGLVFADKRSFTPRIIEQCGITDYARIRTVDLREEPAFAALMTGASSFDPSAFSLAFERRLAAFRNAHADLGGLLIQCNELCSFSALAQRATGLPVYDANLLIRWTHAALTLTTPSGFMFGVG